MKKITTWVFVISIIILIIDWGVAGVKLFIGNYDVKIEAYIALVCLLALFVCNVYKIFNNKCPHCGKLRSTSGKYCSYCGKEI